MTDNEIIEGNEVIAKWDGLIRYDANKDYNMPQWYEPDSKDHRRKGNFVGYPHQLDYHSNWKSLMPVVEKIEAIDGWKVIIFRKCCDIQHDEEDDHQIEITALPSKIKAVYKAVVEFIKWHNSQTSIN